MLASCSRLTVVTSFLVFLLALALRTSRADTPVQFNRDIRPILADRCFTCHGPDKRARKADLRLDVREIAIESAIEPGDAATSELISRITSADPEEQMPPAKSKKQLLNDAEIALIRRWIDQGAKYDAHWSYISPRRPAVPKTKNSQWPRTPIDHFVLSNLEARKLAPSTPADKVALMRRVYFDLIGLPPSPAEVASFVADKSDDAYEKVIDRLLKSPQYGERMAIYWLDLVRYADTVGYHGDQVHNITPYRDYIIKAFNDNMPFDQFTVEQLAGDLLPNSTAIQKTATGYLRVLQTSHEGGVQTKEYLAKYMADRVRNVSAVWMGATMGCAECHDHKYDPYTQRDFYSLGAFFADIQETAHFRSGTNSNPTRRDPEIDVPLPLNPNQKHRTMIAVAGPPRTIRVLPRGDWLDESGEVVQPAVPRFLKPIEREGRATRLDLARWLTSKDHPQTARVFVNRLWYQLYGVGLSKILDDTGTRGEWPTHLELLDWLAVEFIESDWNVKHLAKLMVMSNAYRQSSLETKELRERDPENRLLARQSRFRLPAEMIRDQALAVSGLLVSKLGGNSARPYQPVGYYAHLNFPRRTYKHDTNQDQYRRGVYIHWQRQFLHPMLKAFDAPSREECTAQRPISNTPLAALALLNDTSFVEAARVFAVRIVREGGDDHAAKIAWAWRQTTSRSPSPREVAVVSRLLHKHQRYFQENAEAAQQLLSVGMAPRADDIPASEIAAWTSVARAMMNLNETITRN
jgi:hypothetical protein